MNKLPKEKRDVLIAVAIGAVVAVAALWFLVADAQKQKVIAIDRKTHDLVDTLGKATIVQKTGADVLASLEARKAELAKREAALSQRYPWMMQTLGNFILQRKNVNILDCPQPAIGQETLLVRSPYQIATYHIKGVGYFHEFGKFFADFENAYPYFRIQNWEMAPAGGGAGSEGEKLTVGFDIVAPIMPAEAAK